MIKKTRSMLLYVFLQSNMSEGGRARTMFSLESQELYEYKIIPIELVNKPGTLILGLRTLILGYRSVKNELYICMIYWFWSPKCNIEKD